MSDTPETISTVLAEMRKRLSGDGDNDKIDVTAGSVRALLDRIEAAGLRSPGNAAAMRDLLEKIRHEYGWGRISCRTCVSSEADVERVSDLFEKQIDAALAEPARNCDRFDNYSDARSEYDGNVGAPEWQFGSWLFAPAEGGAK